jgi:hypothetical protein
MTDRHTDISSTQNLLPLLLRPLRLVLSGPSVRNARIVLLKATHWPFVAMIFGYESGRAYLQSYSRAGGAIGSKRTQHRTVKRLRRPLSRHALAMSRTPPSEVQTRSRVATGSFEGPTTRENGTVPFEDETCDAASMASMVAGLQRQLDALAVLVASQQERQ